MNDYTETHSVKYMENKAIIFQNGPFGFWYIRLERGMTPKELKGAYTSPSNAVNAVTALEDYKKNLKN